jgi:hypothetical protein
LFAHEPFIFVLHLLLDNPSVDTIMDKSEKTGTGNLSAPLEVTILSTDVALFADTTKESHVASFKDFWDHIVSNLSNESGVARIRLVIAKSSTLAVRTSKKEGETESGSEGDHDRDKQVHEQALSECIQAIQETIDDVEINGIVGASISAPSVDFTFSVMEGSPLGYQALSRHLVRSTLFAQESSCRLTFDLPETADGTQCCVSFDASYQTFPYAVDSKEAIMLRNELRSLSQQQLKLVQLVPLSAVDAGLLYGVPLCLRSGVEGNLDQFQEMEVLARVLFRFLQERDLAILLRSTNNNRNPKPSCEQMFLLMAQEFPQSTKQSAQTGLLFRYAHAEQLLAEATSARSCPALHDDLGLQYSDYVEEALNTLECDAFNPLGFVSESPIIMEKSTPLYPSTTEAPVYSDSTQGAIKTTKSKADQPTIENSPLDQDETWNDSTGVGSRKTHSTLSDSDAGALFTNENSEPDQEDDIWKVSTGVASRKTLTTSGDSDAGALSTHKSSELDQDDIWNDSAGVGSRSRTLTTAQDSKDTEEDDNDDFPSFDYA